MSDLMNKRSKLIRKNKPVLLLASLITFLIVNSLDRQVFQPFLKSDSGKVHSLTCIQEKSLPVNCRNYRSGLFQRTSSAVKFQLIRVNLEEFMHPESSPTYSLNLVGSTTNVAINYDDPEEAQSSYQKLNELLVRTQESSVCLRYENGFVRWLVIIVGYHFIFIAYLFCVGYFIEQLQ